MITTKKTRHCVFTIKSDENELNICLLHSDCEISTSLYNLIDNFGFVDGLFNERTTPPRHIKAKKYNAFTRACTDLKNVTKALRSRPTNPSLEDVAHSRTERAELRSQRALWGSLSSHFHTINRSKVLSLQKIGNGNKENRTDFLYKQKIGSIYFYITPPQKKINK